MGYVKLLYGTENNWEGNRACQYTKGVFYCSVVCICPANWVRTWEAPEGCVRRYKSDIITWLCTGTQAATYYISQSQGDNSRTVQSG